jgi:hypothetical protein
MTLASLFLLLAAPPFWEARPPAEWTVAELKSMLTESPWVQAVGPVPHVYVILATAKPVRDAETELKRRGLRHPASGARPDQTPDIDYVDYVKAHANEHFVLAIPYTDLAGLGLAEEERRLEEETVMLVGRKRIKMIGHFPPTPSDPVLRLIFPRAVTAADKSVAFDLFLPGVSQPARMVEFRIKDLIAGGRLEM